MKYVGWENPSPILRQATMIDAYQVNIKDRIVLSSQYARERDANNNQIPTGIVNQILNTIDPAGDINSVQFFTNAISPQTSDNITQGIPDF